MINTGFDYYVSAEVEKEGDKPSPSIIKEAKRLLGKGTKVKWFDGRSVGYKGWVWVIGINKPLQSGSVLSLIE